MKIGVFEKTDFSENQIAQLKALGDVDFFEFEEKDQDTVNNLAPQYDVAVVNWIDASPFIMRMKPGSLVSLLSTGYGWMKNVLQDAAKNKVSVTNIPGYSTEAVAEHLLGLLLGVSKNIFLTLNRDDIKTAPGFELKDKTVGIIGLGHIGFRFAEIMNFFGTTVLTYNNRAKNSNIATDTSLNDLLASSDIICITCAVNDSSRGLINTSNIDFIKAGTIIIGSTWNIITNDTLIKLLQSDRVIAAFDAAVEAEDKETQKKVIEDLRKFEDKVFLTPHLAYDTVESKVRQLDVCIVNIENFIKGSPINKVN